jgi:monofunctional glycosyltransferase
MKKWLFLIVVLLVLAGSYLYHYPDVKPLLRENPKTTALIELRKYQANSSKMQYPTEMTWVPIDSISPHLIHAVLLAEDDRFYQHHGFDLEEIRAAVKINWTKKRYAYGGSTITQQLARTLYLSPRKDLIRKFREAIITYRLEKALSKKRILELYLNVAEWGRGLYGAEAASQSYFQKPASDLTPDEAVALASILPSPRRWSPLSMRSFMARRRTRLLERMRRAGYIEPEPSAAEIFDPSIPFIDAPPPLDEPQGINLNAAPDQPE